MNQDNQKKLLLVDGSSYLFRAYHVPGPDLRSPDQKPTKVIYFVLNMLSKLIKDEQPDKIGVVFDAKGKTFRNDIYPEYKAIALPCRTTCASKSNHCTRLSGRAACR